MINLESDITKPNDIGQEPPIYKTAYELPIMEFSKFYTEVNKMPECEYIIEEILPKGQIMLISGDPFSGKSLEFQRIVFEFGKGGIYHGLRCKKCRAAYITWEGAPNKILERMKKLSESVGPGIDPLVKIFSEPIRINTEKGYAEIYKFLSECKSKYPDLEVITYDSFPYMIAGKIDKDEVISEWWAKTTTLHREFDLTPIFVFEERKLIHDSRLPEDEFGLQRLKGSYQIAYKANTVLMIGQNKKLKREDGKPTWVMDGHCIAMVKVKDGKGEFSPLMVHLNRKTLMFDDQHWKFDENTGRYLAIKD